VVASEIGPVWTNQTKPRAKDTQSCGLRQSTPAGVRSCALVVAEVIHWSPKIRKVAGNRRLTAWQ